MKALVLKDKFNAVIDEHFSMPEINDNEVLIRVEAIGVCGTDFKLYRGEYGDAYPLIPGHEFAGIVQETGRSVQGVKPGQRVTAVHTVPCGYCTYCLEGQHNQCVNRTAAGILNHGAFAEYVKVPVANIVPIGDLSFKKATFAEPLSCVIRAVERSRAKLGEKVLVLGTGTTGHLFAQVLKGLGCTVYMLGRNPFKLKIAQDQGIHTLNTTELAAEAVVADLLEQVDIVVDAIGQPQLVEKFVPVLKKGGRLIVFGVSQGQISFNYFDIYRKELQIIGTFAQQEKFPQAIAILKNNAIDVETLITHEGGLEEVRDLLSGEKPSELIKFVAEIKE